MVLKKHIIRALFIIFLFTQISGCDITGKEVAVPAPSDPNKREKFYKFEQDILIDSEDQAMDGLLSYVLESEEITELDYRYAKQILANNITVRGFRFRTNVKTTMAILLMKSKYSTKEEKEKGLILLKEEANTGFSTKAVSTLIDIYFYGKGEEIGISKNIQEGFYWLEVQAKRGDIEDKKEIADIYAKHPPYQNLPFPANIEKAKYWYMQVLDDSTRKDGSKEIKLEAIEALRKLP